VPILRGHAIARIDGDMAEKRVEVRPLGRDGRLRVFVAGAVGLGFGLRPNVELLQVGGAELAFDAAVGGWHARVDGGCETSVPGLYAIGETCGVRGVEAALCDATIAAAAIVERLGRDVSPELAAAVRAARERRTRFVRAAHALGGWARVPEGLADPETAICRCEQVVRRELDAATALDLNSPAAVKMATRIGMGLCQGRVCAENATRAAAGPPRARFPVRPCPADAFAPDLIPVEPGRR
jgi:NAD(P)H-nitrite reductase large subunit